MKPSNVKSLMQQWKMTSDWPQKIKKVLNVREFGRSRRVVLQRRNELIERSGQVGGNSEEKHPLILII
jgi:hypothetical protein